MGLDISIWKVSKDTKEFSYADMSDKAKALYKEHNLFILSDTLPKTKPTFFRLGDFRKCNFILNFFEFDIMEDACKYIEIQEWQIKKLIEFCKSEIENRKKFESGECKENEHILTIASGPFFGTSKYDNWYYECVKYTKKECERILKQPVIDGDKYFIQFTW